MQRFAFRALASGIVLLVYATPATAEVIDKEPTLTTLWLTTLVGGVAAAGAWRWHRVAGATVCTLALVWAWAAILEVHDPSVMSAVVAEAGAGYVRQVKGAGLATLLIQLGAGAIWGRRPAA